MLPERSCACALLDWSAAHQSSFQCSLTGAAPPGSLTGAALVCSQTGAAPPKLYSRSRARVPPGAVPWRCAGALPSNSLAAVCQLSARPHATLWPAPASCPGWEPKGRYPRRLLPARQRRSHALCWRKDAGHSTLGLATAMVFMIHKLVYAAGKP